MMKYNAIIIDIKDVEKIIHGEVKFENGFFHNNKVDWWGNLEEHFNIPIVSIRPSGRDGWNEIIILYANGHIDKEKNLRVLNYDTYEELTNVLHDIFVEAENDEYEVITNYTSTCSQETWQMVLDWVYNVY